MLCKRKGYKQASSAEQRKIKYYNPKEWPLRRRVYPIVGWPGWAPGGSVHCYSPKVVLHPARHLSCVFKGQVARLSGDHVPETLCPKATRWGCWGIGPYQKTLQIPQNRSPQDHSQRGARKPPLPAFPSLPQIPWEHRLCTAISRVEGQTWFISTVGSGLGRRGPCVFEGEG